MTEPLKQTDSTLSPARVSEIEQMLSAVTPGPWRSMSEGNQYQYGDEGHTYIHTLEPQPAARVDGLPRLWNPHAVIGFMKLDAAHVSRFRQADADFIAASPTIVRDLLDGYRALSERVAELEADAKRLDALEREAHIEPLALHDGRQDSIGGLRGLGLMPGNLRRTLREAIDTAFLRSR